MTTKLAPIHPGEILREEFIMPLKINPNGLALALRVPVPGVYEIVAGERSISPEMALRLGYCLNTTPDFWLNLQARYDLETARDKEQAKVEKEVQQLVMEP